MQHSQSLPDGSRTLRAPPLQGTASSSTPHQPISQASSSDEEERTNDTDDVQHLGFGHRVGKKTTRDAYGLYFTGVVRKSWTLPMTRMISHDELIQQHSIPITHDRNTTNMTKHITAVTQMVSDEPSMLYTTVNNDDDEVNESDGDDVVSSQSESDDDNDPEEGELQTPLNHVNPVNPVTENIVPQWESSQWFSNARYDYTHSRAFLDMGSGSPIDDLVESGT
ncbi:hypothetical protein M9H77_11294 [Catharanthus roseus]|uniref:Uncharacterized protein n=1 Tax=Catharanthus roseus TaxID=4058 RepID=A0ACC0BE72_CATRO|nr:hypothetical protein M9H77_11294 [Catharanthus roseus]